MSNTFGSLFRVTTFGESHGGAVGVVIDGCPPNLPLAAEEIQVELDRRRPGQSRLTSARREEDRVQILAGVFEGRTLGTPIALLVWNQDARATDYEHLRDVFRPSHADFTYDAKYGIRNWRGGGRASARETVGRVAAGAVARKLLASEAGIEIVAWVHEVHGVQAMVDVATVSRQQVEAHPVRCPDAQAAEEMAAVIHRVRKTGDSVGGIVGAVARHVPAGLGDPVFDKLNATLGHALLSLPAARGFEVGAGFASARLLGSEHNDAFVPDATRKARTRTNFSGGIQGGISNGEDITLRVAFKPPPTIAREQETVDQQGQAVRLCARGRHDPCVVPRAVPIVEAMMALVLVDHVLRHRGQCGSGPP